jgi:hypothetical protein
MFSAPRRLANESGGFEYFPKGHLKRQLVSEKERIKTIVSIDFKRVSPAPVSSIAFLAAAAVRSMGERALSTSGSRCVICPLPTKIGVFVSSI